jgi:hypothetical protein
MGCQYRINYLDSPDTTTLAPMFIGLSAPNKTTIIKALQGAGIIKAYNQVTGVLIQDSLPNRWPDRVTITYDIGSGPVHILLIRIRTDRF